MLNIYGGFSTLFHLLVRFPLIVLFIALIGGGVIYKSYKTSTIQPKTKLEAVVNVISNDASAAVPTKIVTAPVVSEVTGIPVIGYHRLVNDDTPRDQMVTSVSRFIEEMNYLHDNGYQTLSMDELVDIMNYQKPMPEKAVVINFDDGFDSALLAVPALETLKMKASFWIITGYAGVSPSWQKYMTWEQVADLSKNPNFEIQSHTVTHPYLDDSNLITWMAGTTKDRGVIDVVSEITDSKMSLERNIGKPVNYLAWPAGYYNAELIRMAKKAGYKGTTTTDEGVNKPGDNPFAIKRLFVDGSCNLEQFARMMKTKTTTICH